MDSLAASQGGDKVTDKISGQFSSFLGTDSRAVVVGLRNGTPINLTTTTPSTTSGGTLATTTITPPTGKMGFGNVFITLALAQQTANQYGMTQPVTSSQLQVLLTGGPVTTGTGTTATTTTFQGILTMRETMGWGRIARELNLNLGKVVSGLKASNSAMTATSTSSTGSGTVSASGKPVSSSESGMVTGSGKSLDKVGKGATGTGETAEGIVTGSGRPVSSSGSITTGRGTAYGVSGGSSGGGGQAKGHDK
jgi:hypothetical protein